MSCLFNVNAANMIFHVLKLLFSHSLSAKKLIQHAGIRLRWAGPEFTCAELHTIQSAECQQCYNVKINSLLKIELCLQQLRVIITVIYCSEPLPAYLYRQPRYLLRLCSQQNLSQFCLVLLISKEVARPKRHCLPDIYCYAHQTSGSPDTKGLML